MIRVFWIALIVAIIAIDQFSKWLTETLLPLHEQIAILPFLSFYRTYNEGVAFSFLSSVSDELLIMLTIVIIVFVIWLWKNLESGRFLSALGFALVLGGAIGNLIDRVWLGKVIDMIFFHCPFPGESTHFTLYGFCVSYTPHSPVHASQFPLRHW